MGRLASKTLNPFHDRLGGIAIAVEQGPGLAVIKGQLLLHRRRIGYPVQSDEGRGAAQTWKGLIMGRPSS